MFAEADVLPESYVVRLGLASHGGGNLETLAETGTDSSCFSRSRAECGLGEYGGVPELLFSPVKIVGRLIVTGFPPIPRTGGGGRIGEGDCTIGLWFLSGRFSSLRAENFLAAGEILLVRDLLLLLLLPLFRLRLRERFLPLLVLRTGDLGRL